jgi:hypothetical protein
MYHGRAQSSVLPQLHLELLLGHYALYVTANIILDSFQNFKFDYHGFAAADPALCDPL